MSGKCRIRRRVSAVRMSCVRIELDHDGELWRRSCVPRGLGLGWDQAQFARRVGVGQQTVSRWERGRSTPRRAMIPQIADVLGVDAQMLLDAAVDGQQDEAAGVGLPVRPLLTELPLGKLPEDVFERFSSDLAEQLYPWPDVVHGYGSRGHKQDGIDIEVCHPDGPADGDPVQAGQGIRTGRGAGRREGAHDESPRVRHLSLPGR